MKKEQSVQIKVSQWFLRCEKEILNKKSLKLKTKTRIIGKLFTGIWYSKAKEGITLYKLVL